MSGQTSGEMKFAGGYTAHIDCEITGEGNSLRTRAIAVLSGPATHRINVTWADDRVGIEVEGSWEATALAGLLRGLADNIDPEGSTSLTVG